MNPSFTLPLADPAATLENVGGKGMSLAKMIQASFPVPDGFHITTEAYRLFVQANGLQIKILSLLKGVDGYSPDSLASASGEIEKLFENARIPPEVETCVRDAYTSLQNRLAVSGNGFSPASGHLDALSSLSVAVRSSATAEDLPDASFAGQQETYLNICGIQAVLEAVKKCWASLWTARAIAYRIKNNIDQESVALAVVIQCMVSAENSGILFTANPINGQRDEIVINAAWGLGEAIVGGLVTPDTLVVDKASGRVKKVSIAEKNVITVASGAGTEEKPLTDARRKSQVLKAPQVEELVRIACEIERFYGAPQDIEWCQTGGRIYIVQSRPITTLPSDENLAQLEWKLPKGAYAAMRNNIVELMADPLSPLFATLGLSAVNASLNRLMGSFAMGGIMPENIIVVVNNYAYFNGSISVRSMARMVFGAGKILKMMFTGAVERWTITGRPQYIKFVQSWQEKNWRTSSSTDIISSVRQLTEAAIDAYGALISGVIPAAWMTEAIFTKLYDRMFKRRGDPSAATFLLGFDSLPIQADKALFTLAEWAREKPELIRCLESRSSKQIAAGLNQSSPEGFPYDIWEEWRARFQAYLNQFGCTLYDLDFSHPVPADDPAPVLDTFMLYLHGQGANPITRQALMAERRAQAVEDMQKRLKGRKRSWFDKYLASAQKYAPLREDGLAEFGRAYPLIRQMLRELGQRFCERNIIPTADDIYWLKDDEIIQVASHIDSGWETESLSQVVEQRKAAHTAALRCTPPMALPQMKVFGLDLMELKAKRKHKSKGNEIKGVAASPGKVTGTARIIHGPEDFSSMKAGEILVAPITTPAWTPLFVMASAIVTDVGGPLSHGSIVAREYGIPAVLGTGDATRRIQNGQTISVDGGTGTVVIQQT